MAKKKNKRKGKTNRSVSNQPVNLYKKSLYSSHVPPPEQVTAILEDMKATSKTGQECNQILALMLNDKKFVNGLKLHLTSHTPDVVLLPIGYMKESTIDDNLVWTASILSKFTDELITFNQLRPDLELSLLTSEKSKFENTVNLIEEICGTSLWLESCKFSKLYFSGEDEEVIRIRNNLPEGINGLTRACLLNAIITSRSTVSLDGYLTSLSRQSEDLKLNGYIHFDEYVKAVDYFDPAQKFITPEVVASSFGYAKLIDLFINYKKLLKYCALHKITLPRALGACKALNKVLTDVELANVIFANESGPINNESFPLSEIESNIFKIFDLYIAEKYEAVLVESELVLEQMPNQSILYEVVARSQVIVGRKIKCSSTVSSIIDCIANLSCKIDVEQNVKRLGKYFLNLKQFDWAYHLKAHLVKFDFNEASIVSQQYNYSDIGILRINPFDLPSLKLTLKNKLTFKAFSSTLSDFDSLSAFVNFAVNNEGFATDLELPQWRYLKIQGDKFFKKGDYVNANKFFTALLDLKETGCCNQELKAKIIESNFRLGKYKEAIITLARVLLDDNEPSLFPLKVIAEYIVANVKENNDVQLLESCAIVLYFYNTKCGDNDVTQEISNICENLLLTLGSTKFEQINFKTWNLSPVILTHVLNVEVLDGFVRHFPDDLDVYITRIKLCQNLLEQINEDDDRNLYIHLLNENQSAFNKMVLYFCSSDTSDGRINVDKESLKVTLIDTLTDEYESLYELHDDGKPIEMIRLEDEATATATVTGSDYQVKLTDMLVKIVNEYTMNKLYGIDNSLNVGIRHGEVVHHLWAALKRHNLAGIRLDDSSYNIEDIFDDYKLINENKLKAYKKSYKDFLNEMNKVLKLFRNNCNVDAGELVYEENRFFNYAIRPEWVEIFIDTHRRKALLSQMIDFVFEVLDDRTAELFSLVKNKHIDDLKLVIVGLYSKLHGDLREAPVALTRKISLSKNSMLEQITILRDWFDWADEPKHPFIIGAASEMSKEVILSLHPNISFDIQTLEHNQRLIGSKFFTSFVSIFSLIYENAMEHCGYDEICIQEVFSPLNNGIEMIFTNSVANLKLEHLATKVDEINLKLDGDVISWASKDTGSGIFKVKSMLNNKLKVKNKMSIELKEKQFSVLIIIDDLESLLL